MSFYSHRKPRPKMPPSVLSGKSSMRDFNDASGASAENERKALVKRFSTAACTNDLDTVKEILAQHPDAANWRSDAIFIGNKATPVFILAVLNEQYVTAKMMLDAGGDVDIRDGAEWTALLTAASRGQQAQYKFLVENGADLNAVDHRGRNARTLAQESGHKDMVDYIDRINQGALYHGLPEARMVQVPVLKIPQKQRK